MKDSLYKLKRKMLSKAMTSASVSNTGGVLSRSSFLYKSVSNFAQDSLYPLQINLETTRNCNFRCVFCPRESVENPGDVSVEVFERFIYYLERAPSTVVALHMWGEPLLNKDIFNIIKRIKNTGSTHRVTMTTNGTLLNLENYERLVESGLDQLILSLHTLDPDKYKSSVGINFDIEVLINNLKKISDNANRKEKINLVIRMFPEGEKEKLENQIFFENLDLPLSLENKMYDNVGGHKQEWARLGNGEEKERWACYHPFFTLTITSDGKVTPCCVDLRTQLKLGNILDSSIEDLWRGDTLRQIRNEHLNKSFQRCKTPCANCDTWKDQPDFVFERHKKNIYR